MMTKGAANFFPSIGSKFNSCHAANSGQFCSTGGGRFQPSTGSIAIGTSPYGSAIYDKPLKNTTAYKRNMTVGQKVEFDYSSAQQSFRGSGKIFGFVHNDVVIDSGSNRYFVDGKNVFRKR